jgi:uncharacterized membrane protein YoaK (UPF0700 family)
MMTRLISSSCPAGTLWRRAGPLVALVVVVIVVVVVRRHRLQPLGPWEWAYLMLVILVVVLLGSLVVLAVGGIVKLELLPRSIST